MGDPPVTHLQYSYSIHIVSVYKEYVIVYYVLDVDEFKDNKID